MVLVEKTYQKVKVYHNGQEYNVENTATGATGFTNIKLKQISITRGKLLIEAIKSGGNGGAVVGGTMDVYVQYVIVDTN